MKIITDFLKYFTLIIFWLIFLKLTKRYGNYEETVYDIILIPLIIFVIIINSLILYLIQKKTKNFRILKIIFFIGLIGVLFNLINNSLSKNRKVLSEYEINSKANYNLKLYKNKTFEITGNSPHIFEHWNGKYKISNDTLYLEGINLQKLSYLQLSEKYLYNSKDKNYVSEDLNFLIPKN